MNPHDKQPVSLADELRKLGEKWRGVIKASPAISGTSVYHRCADELSALLDQHAVAEPRIGPNTVRDADGNIVILGTVGGTTARAAEQPKLMGLKYFPLPWHPDEGEPEGAQVYDANNHAVLMLFWPGHPVEETETVERETYALMRLIAKLVNEHFSLLTSPVAPPPQTFEKWFLLWDTTHDPEVKRLCGIAWSAGFTSRDWQPPDDAARPSQPETVGEAGRQPSNFLSSPTEQPPVAPGEQPDKRTVPPRPQAFPGPGAPYPSKTPSREQYEAAQEREGDDPFDDWFQASEWYAPGVKLELIRCAQAAWATAAKLAREAMLAAVIAACDSEGYIHRSEIAGVKI